MASECKAVQQGRVLALYETRWQNPHFGSSITLHENGTFEAATNAMSAWGTFCEPSMVDGTNGDEKYELKLTVVGTDVGRMAPSPNDSLIDDLYNVEGITVVAGASMVRLGVSGGAVYEFWS